MLRLCLDLWLTQFILRFPNSDCTAISSSSIRLWPFESVGNLQKKKKKKFYSGKFEGYQKCWACKQETWIRCFTSIQVFLFKWNSWKVMNKSRLLMHGTSPLDNPKLLKNLRWKIEINVYNDWFRAAEKLSNASPVGIRECPIVFIQY